VVIVQADKTKSGQVGIEGDDNRTAIETEVWPWTALGRINREIGGHCTGALIAPDLVLTAAHCLYNFEDERWTIPMEVHFVAVGTRHWIAVFVASEWQCGRLLWRDAKVVSAVAEPGDTDAGVDSISRRHSLVAAP